MNHSFLKRIFCMCAALTLGFSSTTIPASATNATMVESDLDYTESTDTILNPGVGYTTTLWYRCKPNNTPIHNPTGSIILMFIDIGAFSSGENGTKDDDGNYTPGTDYPLDDAFFAGLRGTFDNCRKNGCTIALRFRYDDDGTQNPEPATFDMLKTHVKQIGDSGILEEYQDILMFVESGLVGCYGEQWGGKYCSLEQKAELLDMLLDIVPDPIPVTVRTPNTFAKWAGIELSELGSYRSEKGSKAARVGMYDDGYMGSDSDLGTYSDRDAQTKWLGSQTRSYFGGEFSGNLEFAQKYDTYLPQNAIPEMYRTHLSYINCNIFNLYKDYTYDKQYAISGIDTSAYYGQTVFKFIRDHLGYRYVLRSAKHMAICEQGDVLQTSFTLENTGFAFPVKDMKMELILEQDGKYVRLDTPFFDSIRTNRLSTIDISAHLPCSVTPGNWNIYLKLSIGDNPPSQTAYRSVQFANNNIWNASLGANYLGTVAITSTQNQLNQTKLPEIPMYEQNHQQVFDGAISNAYEIQTVAAESENGSLFLANDESALYIRAKFPELGEAPVFNVQLDNESNGEHYWIYFANNGFIYYNHGDHTGCIRKNTDNAMEIQIPFGDVMGLKLGTTLKNIRFFLQDSNRDWVLLSDVKADEYVLKGDIPIYTAERTVSLNAGYELPLDIQTGAEIANCQWYHDGKAIAGATSSTYTIPAATQNTVGAYTVSLKTVNGTEQIIPVCKVQAIFDTAKGDCNGDGIFSVADLLDMQKYLLHQTTTLINWKNADFNEDGKLTAVDFSIMKATLVQTNQTITK